jgi:putative Mn2+ efflux pump MntP
MPVIGWGAGSTALKYIGKYDHWIAFALLAFVGGKMILEAIPSRNHREDCLLQDPTRGWKLVFLSVATSIDALAAGMTLAIMRSPILIPALIIGLVAAIFTALGMTLGCRVGNLWKKRAELFGGVLLIAIGAKIVVDHLW